MKTIIALLAAMLVAPAALAENNDMARIVTQIDKPAECLGSVEIKVIDGRLKNVSPLGFDIEPGKHKLSGTAKVNRGNCFTSARGYRNEGVPPLEAEFEAGKTYYIGFDYSSSDRREWAYVIWKVEPEEGEG